MNPNNRVTGALCLLSRGLAYKDLQVAAVSRPPPLLLQAWLPPERVWLHAKPHGCQENGPIASKPLKRAYGHWFRILKKQQPGSLPAARAADYSAPAQQIEQRSCFAQTHSILTTRGGQTNLINQATRPVTRPPIRGTAHPSAQGPTRVLATTLLVALLRLVCTEKLCITALRSGFREPQGRLHETSPTGRDTSAIPKRRIYRWEEKYTS